MKFFLSARYSRRDELRRVRTELIKRGHTVVSRWLDTEWEHKDDQGSSAAPPAYRAKHALEDFEDVRACDCLVAFTDPPGAGGRRGGRHVEFGLAAAWGKKLIVVGPLENIFHHLPGVKCFPEYDWFIEVVAPPHLISPFYP